MSSVLLLLLWYSSLNESEEAYRSKLLIFWLPTCLGNSQSIALHFTDPAPQKQIGAPAPLLLAPAAIRKQLFYQTALGNCYGLKLPKCWLRVKRQILLCHFLYKFRHTFVPVSSIQACTALLGQSAVAAHLWLSSNAHWKLTFIFRVFINIVFITFRSRAVDIVKCPWCSFFIYDTFILTILHYITLHYCCSRRVQHYVLVWPPDVCAFFIFRYANLSSQARMSCSVCLSVCQRD